MAQVGPSWVKLILVGLLCPPVGQEFAESAPVVLVSRDTEHHVLHPFTRSIQLLIDSPSLLTLYQKRDESMETTITNAVTSALDMLELNYNQDEELFTLVMSEDDADFKIRILADEKNELLLTIGYFPVKISKSNLDKMYKVINDMNNENLLGAFVIDSCDGELSYRVTNNVDDGAVNERVVIACFFQVVNRLKNTYDDIMKAMYGGEQYTFTFGDNDQE